MVVTAPSQLLPLGARTVKIDAFASQRDQPLNDKPPGSRETGHY
jgi:hypothetical protein